MIVKVQPYHKPAERELVRSLKNPVARAIIPEIMDSLAAPAERMFVRSRTNAIRRLIFSANLPEKVVQSVPPLGAAFWHVVLSTDGEISFHNPAPSEDW
jgi:hypothetical protein